MSIKISDKKKWSEPVWWKFYAFNYYRFLPRFKTEKIWGVMTNPKYYHQLRGYVKRLKMNQYHKEGRLKGRYIPQKAFAPRRVKYMYRIVNAFNPFRARQYPIAVHPKLKGYDLLRHFKSRRRFIFTRFYSQRPKFTLGTKHLVHIKPVFNNIFLNLSYRNHAYYQRNYKGLTRVLKPSPRVGRTIKFFSTGLVGYKGPKRSTPIAAEDVGRALARYMNRSKIKKFVAVYHSGKDKKTYAAVKGLLDSRLKLRIRGVILRPAIPHSKGLRKPKQRRV
jgi:ribosomal protein S11